jgi:hypothetical protein
LPKVENRNAAKPLAMKAALFALDQFTAWHETCWPSTELIAEVCCTSERNAQRAVVQLVALGLLTYKTRRATSGKQIRHRRWFSSREYRIEFDALARLPRAGEKRGGDRLTPPDRLTGVPARPGGGDRLTPPKTNMQEEDVKLLASGNGHEDAAAPGWEQEIRPALLHLGLAPARLAGLCRAAGTRERVVEILQTIRIRQRKRPITNPAGYFAAACHNADWKPTAEERRRIERTTRCQRESTRNETPRFW